MLRSLLCYWAPLDPCLFGFTMRLCSRVFLLCPMFEKHVQEENQNSKSSNPGEQFQQLFVIRP